MTKIKMPMGMRYRKRGKKIYYYLDNNNAKNRKLISLGSCFTQALIKYTELTHEKISKSDIYTFNALVHRYTLEIIPTKAPRTQKDNLQELIKLNEFFNNAPLDEIKPMHCRQFLDWRKEAKTRANRELALFSHMFNWARNWGMTDMQNPCLGIKKHKEQGRDVYISDDDLNKLLDQADIDLKNAIKLAYLTGQRPADVLKMKWSDIYMENGKKYLFVRQNKTNAKISILIIGELEKLLNLIPRSNIVDSPILLTNEGNPLTISMLNSRFNKARKLAGIDKNDFQFRDLRAKAGTDTANIKGIKAAQSQLGHANESMTKHYVRNEKGEKTEPTR